MTKGDKYKTAQERADAFRKWCDYTNSTNLGCDGCVLSDSDCCQFAWLDLEEEEEKPLPCPFCGCETIVRLNWNGTHQVVCNSQGCWYCSKCETSKSEAIAAHNRVAM